MADNTDSSHTLTEDVNHNAGLDKVRIRFTLSLGLFAATVGALAVIVNLLSQSQFSYEASHLSWGKSTLFGMFGALGGFVTAVPFSYWLYGRAPTFQKEDGRSSRKLVVWLTLGLMFGLVYPLIMGGFFLPISLGLVDVAEGETSVPNHLMKMFDLLSAQWPGLAIVLGFRLFFTGIYAGVIFGAGAWVIDRFSASSHSKTSVYGPWMMSASMSVALSLIIAFSPVTVLHRLGG